MSTSKMLFVVGAVSAALMSSNAIATATTAAPRGHGIIRLVDHVSRETVVRSPLMSLSAAQRVEDVPGKLKATTVFAQDFENFQFTDLGWPENGPCVLKDSDESGQSLVYRGGGSYRYALVLPVKSQTHYRVRRSIRTSDRNVDIRIQESMRALKHPATLNHHQDIARIMAGRSNLTKNLIRVHRLPAADKADRWQSDSLHFFTSPHTKSIAIVIADAEGVISGRSLEVWLDDIVLEVLEPTHQQELAILKARDPAEGADPKLGMAKHAQFLPVGNAERVRIPHDHNFDYRSGIFAPAPTTLSFPMRLPPHARFSFSYALTEASRPKDKATFKVALIAEGKRNPIFKKTLDRTHQRWHWHEARLDLSRWGGQNVILELSTDAPNTSRGYAVWGAPVIDTPREESDPPNVILIAVDTLRADRLSSYGNPRDTSPNLDALAADGVRFTQATSTSNWTSASFGSLFTGLMPSRHNVIHRARAIAPSVTTLTEHFRAAGYGTFGIAYKAYLYNMGFEQGFDRWFNVPRATVKADHNLEKAIQWIEDQHDRRFFLFLHMNDPHQPFNQPAPFDRRYNDERAITQYGGKLPITIGINNTVKGCPNCITNGKPTPGFKKLAADLYDGAIHYIDDRIGSFIEALKQRGAYDNTIIVFLSDHGEMMWEHNNYFGHGSNMLYDELIRVPLILKPHRSAQGLLSRGAAIDNSVSIMDIGPTLLALAGLPLAEGFIGRDLSPALRGGALPGPTYRVSENVKQHVMAARSQQWKLVIDHRPGRATNETLYNLTADPKEHQNVLADNPQAAKSLRIALMDHLISQRVGKYLLVTGKDGEKYDISVHAPDALDLDPYIGARPRRSGQTYRFTGPSRGGVALFAELTGPEGAEVSVSVRGAHTAQKTSRFNSDALRANQPSSVARFLATAEATVHLLVGPEPLPDVAERTGIDADQIATLKAMGYIQ